MARISIIFNLQRGCVSFSAFSVLDSEDTQNSYIIYAETRHEGLPLVLDTSVTILILSTRADFFLYFTIFRYNRCESRSFMPVCSFPLDSAAFEKIDLELFFGKDVCAAPREMA